MSSPERVPAALAAPAAIGLFGAALILVCAGGATIAVTAAATLAGTGLVVGWLLRWRVEERIRHLRRLSREEGEAAAWERTKAALDGFHAVRRESPPRREEARAPAAF